MDGQPSGAAVAWTTFASYMMVMFGFWWVFSGLTAIINDDFFVVTQEWVFRFSTTTWGWVHLTLGFVVLLSGYGLFTGAVWARTVGVLLSVVAGVLAFAWLPYYPLWGAAFIFMSMSVIWALTAHGRDVTM